MQQKSAQDAAQPIFGFKVMFDYETDRVLGVQIIDRTPTKCLGARSEGKHLRRSS